MRIGIDAQFAAYQHRGIGRYIVQLVSDLARADSANQYVIYGPAAAFPELRSRSNFQIREVGNPPYPVWEQFMLPCWAQEDRLDLLHCPANTAPLRLPRRVRLVMTVHDVMYLLPATVLPRPPIGRLWLGSLYRRVIVPRSCGRAARILTISEFSRQQIVEWLGVPADRIRVTYLGKPANVANGIPVSAPTNGSRPPFILALGAPDPRKNTERVIRAYGELRRSAGVTEQLRIVGLRDWKGSIFDRLTQQLGLQRDIIFEDYVSDSELAQLYAGARCFVYPSLYEGFGFPPLEAMIAGTPVVASAASSIPEIAGDTAVYVDPASTESISAGILQVLNHPEARAARVEKGRVQANRFKSENTAAQTLAVYNELLAYPMGS